MSTLVTIPITTNQKRNATEAELPALVANLIAAGAESIIIEEANAGFLVRWLRLNYPSRNTR